MPIHGSIASRPGRATTSNESQGGERRRHKTNDFVRISMQRTTARTREVFKDSNAVVPDATGTYTSIKEWAEAANLDKHQRRAFESIISAFLLTFWLDPSEDDNSPAEKVKLKLAIERCKRMRGSKEKTW